MAEEPKDKWFSKLAKVAHRLAPKDRGVDRAFEQLKTFHEACQSVVLEVMAGQSLLEKEIEKNTDHIAKWEARAMTAVEQDNESLAISCLTRKASYMKSSMEYEARLPLMRQRRLQMHARFESVNTIVHRILILKDLLETLPKQSTLRDDLLAAIKNFIDEMASFAKDSEEKNPSFSKALVVAEQRIAKLEQQLAGCAINFKKSEPAQAAALDETIKTLKATTEATIAKVQEHLEIQKSIAAQRETEKNEDSAWEARQLIWSDEKTIESLKTSLNSLESILQHQVASSI